MHDRRRDVRRGRGGAPDGRADRVALPVRAPGADILGRGLRRSDRLDGSDAAGLHRELVCPNCSFVFVVGIDEEGQTGQAVCPNCGQRGLDDAPSIECGGDRVLVQKFLYDFRRPRRWEVAVFHFPGEPIQAYVKRVVGLPGESIRIVGGDIFVDGQIVRKSLPEIRAMRMLVHDSRFQPEMPSGFPRWQFRRGTRYRSLESGWISEDGQFVHAARRARRCGRDDWLVYKHWDPARGRYGPVRDFYAYNGGELAADNEVARPRDRSTHCASATSVDAISVALRSGSDQFRACGFRSAGEGRSSCCATTAERSLTNRWNPFRRKRLVATNRHCWRRGLRSASAGRDRRAAAFRSVSITTIRLAPGPASESPIALGVRGGGLEVSELRIYRDIYYTGSLANTPRHSHGMSTAVQARADEYFVLGDNSPVSNDSRFWSEGPVVRGSMFVGKPFLVHLPGQVVPLKVFGRSVCWVPDPRRIRYIR